MIVWLETGEMTVLQMLQWWNKSCRLKVFNAYWNEISSMEKYSTAITTYLKRMVRRHAMLIVALLDNKGTGKLSFSTWENVQFSLLSSLSRPLVWPIPTSQQYGPRSTLWRNLIWMVSPAPVITNQRLLKWLFHTACGQYFKERLWNHQASSLQTEWLFPVFVTIL